MHDVTTKPHARTDEANNRWSEFDRTGSAQHYYYLSSALGYSNSLVSSVNIDLDAYDTDSAIYAWDTEKVPQAIMTCHNCSSGALITTKWKSFGNATANQPKKTHIAAHYDCVLEFSGQAAQVHS